MLNPAVSYRGYEIRLIKIDASGWQVQSYQNEPQLPPVPVNMGRYLTYEEAVAAAKREIDSALAHPRT